MSFLLDTDTCSAYMKGDGNVINRFIQYGGRLSVSVVTVGELYSGVFRSQASPCLRSELAGLLNNVTILDVTYDVAYRFGTIRARLLDQGLPAPGMDLLIAATALTHNLTLATHNTAHFVHVPGPSLVDWLVP
jgi:predicted nucleic acid-binding protein